MTTINAPKINQVVICEGAAYGKLIAYSASSETGFYFFDLKNGKTVNRYRVPVANMKMEKGDLSVSSIQHIRRIK